MMNIVIPTASRGSRFQQVGYGEPLGDAGVYVPLLLCGEGRGGRLNGDGGQAQGSDKGGDAMLHEIPRFVWAYLSRPIPRG